MAMSATILKDTPVTGNIRLVAGPKGTGLMMARTARATRKGAPPYEAVTTLTPIAFGKDSPSLPSVTIPQALPPPPAFDLGLAADGTLGLVYQMFGGASNRLRVAAAPDGKLKPLFDGLPLVDCALPRFVRDTSGKGAATPLVTTTFDDQQVALIVPGKPDEKGRVAVAAIPLVKAAAGVAFGDLTAGMPTALRVIYKTDRRVGPLAPGNLFVGHLALATFDASAKRLGTPVPLLGESAVAEFDIAYQGGLYVLLATTGDGKPILAGFDAKGTLLGDADLPFGSWSGADRWVTSLTIVADPQAYTTGALKFVYAFIEMDGDKAAGVVVGQIGATPDDGVEPPPNGAATPS